MKKVSILLTLLVLILTACSAASTTTDQAVTAQEATAIADIASDIASATQTALAPIATVPSLSASSATLTTDYENAVPVSMQLTVGILQLENTDQAITPAQAESFITVLNFLKDLSTNTTATQEQIDSVIEQAESILTDEQIAAIANMHITQDTMMSLMQNQGNGNLPPQGDMPQGTPPAGGPGGQPPSGDPMGTPPANGTQPNMGFVPPQLIDTLIQLMESKIANS